MTDPVTPVPVVITNWMAMVAAIIIASIPALLAWLKGRTAERKADQIIELKNQLVIANRHIEDLRIMARVLLDKEKLLKQYEVMKEDLAIKHDILMNSRAEDLKK